MDETDPPDLQDSTPGSSGPHRAEGSMGTKRLTGTHWVTSR